MRNICLGLAALFAVAFTQPAYADCGGYNQVEYVRSSQRERGTDFRIKVHVSDSVVADLPVVDVKTTLVDGTETVAYSFVLGRNAELHSSGSSAGWSYEDRTDTTYTRIGLTPNSDGTSTLRVAMRVPYTVFNGGLGYYASIRSCE